MWRPRVLLVGHGPPMAGGIPSFIAGLLADVRLRERVDLRHLNTAPLGEKRPGSATAANVREGFLHARRVRHAARGADVVHLNVAAAPTWPLVKALSLAAAARSSGAKVVLHAHTGRLPRSVESPPYRRLLRIAGGLVDAFVVVSREAEEAVSPYLPNVVRIENAIDVAAFRAGPKQDPPSIAFVGTVCERKGLLDLRDALLLLGDDVPFHLRIVGDARQEGPGEYERIVSAFREAPGLSVAFTGALDHPDVVDVLTSASVFCLPSHWEGFPLSLLEAMAAGCAVVASEVGDIPEILGHGEAGILIPARRPDRLAEALRRLADPALRRRLGAAARARVASRYDGGRLRERVHQLYADLTGHSM